MLPSFPVAFILAKDGTIKVFASMTESKHADEMLKENSSSSGGFLYIRESTLFFHHL